MSISAKLGPGSDDCPEELMASSYLTQMCLESMLGASITTTTASRVSDATPQASPPSVFDALVRENAQVIERVSYLQSSQCTLLTFSLPPADHHLL